SSAASTEDAIFAAQLGYNMYKCNQEFKGGDGIVMKDIETTIKGIGRLGKDGMRQTNEEIIRLMMS
ncbi:serine dehydratase subunit alpha family protein, partial [Faecalibacterium sp. DFI.5.82]|nr:serine dehydratase subunit alpha family protein [Faecalibacterium sp. DFI.5.82]